MEIVSFVPIKHRNAESVHVPSYATLTTRTTLEHVLAILPPSVTGEPGLVRLVAAYIGTDMSWVQIRCDPHQLLRHRDRDMYFVYYSLTNRLPLPRSLVAAADVYVPRPLDAAMYLQSPNAYTRPLPLSGDVYYTRSGHIGSCAELQCRSQVVECVGYMIDTLPCPQPGMVVVTTRRRAVAWRQAGFPLVVAAEDLDAGITANTLVVDGAAIVSSLCMHAYPDGRHLSGTVSTVLQCIDHHITRQSTLVLKTPSNLITDQWIVDCLYLLRVTLNGRRFILQRFTHPRSTMIQAAETLFLQGVLMA